MLKDQWLELQSKQFEQVLRRKISVKAKELLTSAEKVLDSSASKKVIHKNAAARTKSRLSKAVKALG